MKPIRERMLENAARVPLLPNPSRKEDEEILRDAALRIAGLAPSGEDFAACERALAARPDPGPVGPALALKTARSLGEAAALPAGMTVRVLFAVHRERTRLAPPRPGVHGEDLLGNKIGQLEFLFGASGASWTITVVDDGCPEGSGRIAAGILARSRPDLVESGRVRVLFLEKAVAAGDPDAAGIPSASASRKGGSILFGLRKILRGAAGGDALLYTDADLSTHLAQAGLLAGPIARGTADLAAGSRRAWNSFQVKSKARDRRGKLFIHLWKRMLPLLEGIVDSQAAFKAFRAAAAGPVLERAREIGFAFDLELLLLARLEGLAVATEGICWIDSEEESATAGPEVHLDMLRSASALRRRLLPPESPGGDIARFVDSLDLEGWNDLLRDPPAAILEAPPERLGDPALF